MVRCHNRSSRIWATSLYPPTMQKEKSLAELKSYKLNISKIILKKNPNLLINLLNWLSQGDFTRIQYGTRVLPDYPPYLQLGHDISAFVNLYEKE